MVTATDRSATDTAVRSAVAAVPDPELPVLTIAELGILRDVTVGDGRVVVTVTPTYSGCPAMDAIRRDIHDVLTGLGVSDAEVRTVLDPPWSTDRITAEGRRKLAEAGIAPPAPVREGMVREGTVREGPLPLTLTVRCPRCGSPDTAELSRFSSTACKALWRCRSCGEPFDRVKEH
jgi:ring-1,2-phenylacetyl-CoA epoxidase subunit PaaD